MIFLTCFLLLLTFIASSIFYVYLVRGKTRYLNFTEYWRKGWPLFAPMNTLLYMFTEARGAHPILKTQDFKELDEITRNWKIIRDEAMQIYEKGFFDKTKEVGSNSSFDLGFRTFYKYGWGKFYVNWYGHIHESALRYCPKTVEILKKIPSVNGAMFSILPVGSKLTRHLDPVACSFRYHLGLKTPNDPQCFINVDGTKYSWKDGEAFLFDETYLHFANNDAETYRLILMCDVERPLSFPGKIINAIVRFFMQFSVVPNMAGDKQGLVNKIFSGLAPMLQKAKELKQIDPPRYKLLKYTVNISLMLLSLIILAMIFKMVVLVSTKLF